MEQLENSENNTKDPLNTLGSLRAQLELLEWPNVYLFKFIVPNESEQIAQVTALFNQSSEVVMHPSKTGKYMSFSVKELMLDADSIMQIYEKATQIKGIISL
jgi:putative lipoic acid-binding regulatory protein